MVINQTGNCLVCTYQGQITWRLGVQILLDIEQLQHISDRWYNRWSHCKLSTKLLHSRKKNRFARLEKRKFLSPQSWSNFTEIKPITQNCKKINFCTLCGLENFWKINSYNFMQKMTFKNRMNYLAKNQSEILITKTMVAVVFLFWTQILQSNKKSELLALLINWWFEEC